MSKIRFKNTSFINGINRFKVIIFTLLILVTTFFAFYPSLNNSFTNWDDNKYVTGNYAIQHFNLKRIFSSFFVANYHPLTILTYSFDYSLFKFNPFGYHLTNLVLHLLNSLLVFWLCYILAKNVPVALIAAIFFGIHPLHAEPVAWISARKDVLYAFFFLGAMIFYIFYLREKQISKHYFFSLILFVFSLLSKPMAITLPIALLFIDYFFYRKCDKAMIIDKVPFFILSIVFGFVAVFGQHLGSGIRSEGVFNLLNKFAIANYTIIFYLNKIFMPIKFSCLYPHPEIKQHALLYLYTSIVVTILLIIIIISGKHTRKIIFAGGFFLVTLIPTLQFIPISRTIVADRYVYIPSIGIFYIIASGFVWLYTRRTKYFWLTRFFLMVLLIVIISTLSFLTWERCQVWNDSITLWNDVIKNYPNVYLAYNNRGVVYYNQGNLSQALLDYNRAIQINPDYAEAYNNRGRAYHYQGNLSQALPDYNMAIQINPRDAVAYNNRGNLYHYQGNLSQALLDYNMAIQIKPDYADPYNNRAIVYFLKKDYSKSWEDMHRAEALEYKVNVGFIEQLKKASGREK